MTEQPNDDTWNDRDLPVLRCAVDVLDQPLAVHVGVDKIADTTGLTREDVVRAGRNLTRAGLVTTTGAMGAPVLFFTDFSDEALRLTGRWPTPETALDRMLAALQTIANNNDIDDDTRQQARGFRTWLKTSATTIGLGVATAAITGQLPGA